MTLCIDYIDYFASFYSIGGLNSLVDARIHIYFEYMDVELENIWSLVSPLSNVRFLCLEYGFVKALDTYNLEYKLPIFRNLNHLQLGCQGVYSWNKGIMAEIDEQHERYLMLTREEIESWSKTQVIPSCLRFHLKRIIIEEYLQTEWELEMVKYFLRNASVLEELLVVCKTTEPLADKIQLGRALQELPRGSMTCSINVE
uniref:FBD domain-containing protein n=1 Tax=Chenopodium quinoa TaxID=63459 RepID=A0A803LZF2_CHEQI